MSRARDIANSTETLDVDGGTIKLDGNYPVGTGNVALGNTALDSNVSGASNTAIGADALTANTASNNTAVGYQAGYYITTGSKNTILGRYDGNQGDLDIRTSDNNIVLSDGDGNPRGIFNSSGHFIVGATDASFNNTAKVALRKNTDSYFIAPTTAVTFNRTSGSGTLLDLRQGAANISGTISVTTSSASYNTSSDYRLKENVVELTNATDRLKQLNPSRFNFIVDPDTTVDGFLAHEVQTVVPEAITGTHNEIDDEGNPVYQGIDQAKLVPLLTAALQEAIGRIETLEAEVATLKGN